MGIDAYCNKKQLGRVGYYRYIGGNLSQWGRNLSQRGGFQSRPEILGLNKKTETVSKIPDQNIFIKTATISNFFYITYK